jgi:TusA-related sulfurtransferase
VADADYELDITGEVCPMTFVRTKLLLERMTPGQVASIKLRGGEPLDNVPRAVRDHGHEVVTLGPLGNDLYQLVIRRC